MSDNISRQAVLEWLKTEWDGMVTSVFDGIGQLPSADRWIPCSERLPEIEHGGQRRGWYLTTDDYECVNITQYEFHCSFLKTGWQSDTQILAWMPLPEPYKERSQYEGDYS